MIEQRGSIVGGALLVAGTTIGGGMLALPVMTASGGFVPAVILYCLCWLFMLGTGILLLDLFLKQPRDANLLSLATFSLGKKGRIATWILYLFLFSCLMIAYVSGGGGLVSTLLGLPSYLGPLLFTLLLTPLLALGPHVVDRSNAWMMVGLLLCFLVFVGVGMTHIQPAYLRHYHVAEAVGATPLLFTSFGFQGLVPTLVNYLGRDRRSSLLAMFWGSLLPLLLYILWEILILGLIPLPVLELARLFGQTAITPMKNTLHAPWLYFVGQVFAFLTLATSFLGVGLAFVDFLADGFSVKKTAIRRSLLSLAVVAPPTLLAMLNPCLFLKALHYGGGLGGALLLGVLPIVMAWRVRHQQQTPLSPLVLGIMGLFVLFVMGVMVKAVF